jgi:Spy/CpxP family protein refolding chaperone
MRRLAFFTVTCLAIGLMTGSTVFGQGRGGRGFGGGPRGADLLANEQVQKELNLSAEQTAKIQAIAEEARPQRGQGGGNFRNLPQEERDKLIAEFRKKAEEAAVKATAELTPDQLMRFKQIEIWVQGPRALAENAEVVKTVGVTDEQKAAIKTITDESDKKRQELFSQLGRNASDEDRKKAGDQSAELRKTTEAECLAVLTDGQKSQFEKLKGPKFELDRSAFRGRGRGRPRGDNT